MNNSIKEMEQWIETLNKASFAYYNGHEEIMSDFEWDALFNCLQNKEKELGIILPNSPTNRVSADSIIGEKELHEFPMLSLTKTKQITDIDKWCENKPVWISWKLDGLTLVAIYDNGKLSKLLTRGDGHTGTNVTHLATSIIGIPLSITYTEHIVIRGELVISYKDFNLYCENSKEEYANPRNLASGSLTLKNIDELKKRNLTWIPFNLVYIKRNIISWGERMNFLKQLGFVIVDREKINIPDNKTLYKTIKHWSQKVNTHNYIFPVDGLVFCYDDVNYAHSGEITGHHAIREGIAYKWQDTSIETVLESIEWSCATSSIVPIANFNYISLEGTTVKRASLYNISECERLGIGNKGTIIKIIKANKIIPKVIFVKTKIGNFNIPKVCPVCNSPTKIIESNNGIRKLICLNDNCPGKKLCKFTRFVSKEGINITGLSKEIIKKFIIQGWIVKYGDLYRLKTHYNEIKQLEGFGEKSTNNIINSIEQSRNCNSENLLTALSIPLIGKDIAKKIFKNYTFKELIDKGINSLQCNENIFKSIKGIGEEISKSFILWCSNKTNIEELLDLLTQIVVINKKCNYIKNNRFNDVTFVITGKLYYYKNRNTIKTIIELNGGKVENHISTKTSFLINNDIKSISNKNKKAKELGIPIISEEEFIKKLNIINNIKSYE